MIAIKTSDELSVMREGGKKLWKILQTLLEESVVGVSLKTIEDHAQQYIKDAGATPSFVTVGGYKWATCLCINDQVVHGIPSAYTLREGDVFTIDIGMIYKGLHTDTAWTKIIKIQDSKINEEKEKFLAVGQETLKKAIKAAKAGNRVGHISQAIEEGVTGAGYSVIPSLTGHGVGKKLHEEPMIPGYLDKPLERTPLLTTGMTLAVEIIYAFGKGAIVYSTDDGWTLSSKDRSLTAVFERTIAIGDAESSVLTGS